MQIVLSGSTGFLGSYLAREFSTRGWQTTALIRAQSPRLPKAWPDNIQLFELGQADLKNAFSHAEPSIIVHCAGSYGRNGESIQELRSINVEFGKELFQAGVSKNAKAFIYADSSLPFSVSPYAQTKAELRNYLMHNSDKLKVVDLQLEHFYGPGDDESKFVTRVVRTLLRKEPSLALTMGEQKRDFIYISDVLSAFGLLISHLEKLPEFEVFPLGSGQVVTIRELVDMIACRCENSQTKLDFGAVPYRANELMHSCANISKLLALGWSPKVSLENGLDILIEAEKALQENIKK